MLLCSSLHRLPRARALALFPFELVNTGMLPTQPEETARLKTVEEITRQRLTEAGFRAGRHGARRRGGSQGQFPTRLQRLRARSWHVASDAQLAAVGWVQKVSNLILNINLQIRDAHSGAMLALGSVDIRGNTDESWRRGTEYLLKHRILPRF